MKKNIIVWLDVDDVLLDFKAKYNRHLRINYGLKIKDNYVPKNWHYTEVLPKKVSFAETMQGLGMPWAKNLKPIDQAMEFTQKLKSLGIKVILITHIEGEQGPDRIENLVENKIHFDEIYFTMGRKKSEFAKAISLRYPKHQHIFVDDKAENVTDFLTHVPKTIFGVTMDLPYNDPVIASWDDTLGTLISHPKNQQGMFKVVLNYLKKHFK